MIDPVSAFIADFMSNTLFVAFLEWLGRATQVDEAVASDDDNDVA